MTTKKIFLVIILFTVTAVLFGEELEFVTVKKTMLYNNIASNPRANDEPIFEIDEGTKVIYTQWPYITKKILNNKVESIVGTFEYNKTKYYIDCTNLVPSNTINIFDSSFITDLNNSNRKVWVPSYYVKVLQSLERNTILLLDPFFEKKYDPYWQQNDDKMEWFDYFIIFFPRYVFDITNSAMILNENIRFIVKRIKKTNNGYIVTVKFAMKDWEDYIYDSFNWDSIKGKEFFDMILYIGGEYMDVYLDDMEHKLTTFALVDQIFLRELKSLVENKKVDLSKVHFPRRADGSIDNYLTSELLTDTDVTQIEDKTPEAAIEKNAFSKNNADKTSLPLWAWFVFIGIAVAVSGGVAAVIVVLRKKAG